MGRLVDLESGKTDPTRSLLAKMSTIYRQPLITFYMMKPPIECDYGIDFRSHLPGKNARKYDANLKALIRDIRVRQDLLKAVLEDEDEAENLSFVASQKMSDGIANVRAKIHEIIGIDSFDYYAQNKPKSAFDLLRNRTQRAGVFVLLKGDLGSYHSAIGLAVFRGFVIADSVAPFIVINSRDAKPALSFTLLHELVHLILGNTGVSGIDPENDVERFCDDVASSFLLPTNELRKLHLQPETEIATAVEHIREFSSPRNLSRSMVAYRAWRSGKITHQSYRRLNQRFRTEWNQFVTNQREVSEEQQGGPEYYTVHKYRIGKELIETTQRMLLSGALTTFKAAKILSVKAGNVEKMFD